jgi:hypothetical protein
VPAPKLTCQELVELVADYPEGTLPVPERRRFDEHFATCDGCVNCIEQMGTTIRLVGRLREDDLWPRVRGKLLSLFHTWEQLAAGARRALPRAQTRK